MITRKSPVSLSPWRTPYGPWRRFEPAVLMELLETVAAVNAQLLEALVHCARSDNLEFPLPASLRGPVAQLTVFERDTMARCGVLLADVGPLGITCSQGATNQSGMGLSTEQVRPWLPTEQSISLAHSVLLVSWFLLHASPDVARVLLGIDAPGVEVYRLLGVDELAHIARNHPDRVRPRWGNQLEAWTVLLRDASGTANPDPRSMTLRCLQMSAGSSAGISLQLGSLT
jgi:hypothetical protein